VLNTTIMAERFRIGLAALVLLAAARTAVAQNEALEEKLAAAKKLECTFSVVATGTWDGKTPKATVKAAKVEAGFHDIDIDGGTAEADSSYGSSFISVRYADGYLHLMQAIAAGPLYVTTVFARTTPDGRFLAIQTRAEYTPIVLPEFTSRPEMYIGSCKVSP
jgi:hypothetical protein